jgi:hypothetical protein
MSNRLLDNRSFNKLAVNRLEAQAIRSDNVQPSQPSYLFSVLLENGTFNRNNTGGTLTFDIGTENNNVIQFSDRPFRQTQKISISTFVNYFTLGGSDSFKEDPPNMVLAHSQEQRTYIMKLSSKSNNQVVFTLELLPGETHNLNTVTGRMSVFVDDFFDDLGEDFYDFGKDIDDGAKDTEQDVVKAGSQIGGIFTSTNKEKTIEADASGDITYVEDELKKKASPLNQPSIGDDDQI